MQSLQVVMGVRQNRELAQGGRGGGRLGDVKSENVVMADSLRR